MKVMHNFYNKYVNSNRFSLQAHFCSLLCIVTINLTSFKHYAVIGYFVSSLQAWTVPAVTSELMLALMDGNLDSLDCWSCHVWVPHAHIQLAPRQPWQRQTHRVGVQDWVNVGELQSQDFIGAYPAGSTQVRLLTRQTYNSWILSSMFHSLLLLTNV